MNESVTRAVNRTAVGPVLLWGGDTHRQQLKEAAASDQTPPLPAWTSGRKRPLLKEQRAEIGQLTSLTGEVAAGQSEHLWAGWMGRLRKRRR